MYGTKCEGQLQAKLQNGTHNVVSLAKVMYGKVWIENPWGIKAKIINRVSVFLF